MDLLAKNSVVSGTLDQADGSHLYRTDEKLAVYLEGEAMSCGHGKAADGTTAIIWVTKPNTGRKSVEPVDIVHGPTKWKVVCQHEFEGFLSGKDLKTKRNLKSWQKSWVTEDGRTVATRNWEPGKHPVYRIAK